MIIEHLTVLYDAQCGFCTECRKWIQAQRSYVELEFIAKGSPLSRERFPGLEQGNDELIVIDDRGGVYRAPDSFLMCLYALEDYRAWSLRLSSPSLRPMARLAFELVSKHRHRINDWLKLRSDAEIEAALHRTVGPGTPRCAAG